MAQKATKLEDIGDERDQRAFMAGVKVFFDGNFQAALDEYNKSVAKSEAYRIKKKSQQVASVRDINTAEVQFHLPHQ